jgi:hypothetical protein
MLVSLEVEGRYHGTFRAGGPYSLAWYCANCGEVYARRTIMDEPAQWFFTYGWCSKCASHRPLGWHQIFRSMDEVAYNRDVSVEILAAELLFSIGDSPNECSSTIARTLLGITDSGTEGPSNGRQRNG